MRDGRVRRRWIDSVLVLLAVALVAAPQLAWLRLHHAHHRACRPVTTSPLRHSLYLRCR